MRFLTLSGALLLLGLVSAEPSLECAMYAEACESLCVLNRGGELAIPKCAMEATSCLCDGADMSDFVNQNAVGYINNLNENDLDQFIDSSYERYEAMIKETAEINGAAAPVVNDMAKLEKDALNEGMMNALGAFDASTRNLKFNLVLDKEGDDEEEEEGDEEEEEAAEEDSDENDEKQDKNDADELKDEEEGDEEDEEEEEEDVDEDSKGGNKKPASNPLARAQDPFCQTFLSRCKDDCSASQADATCALEDSNSGYLLACACNGVDISASVYAQVKAENQVVDI